MALPDVSRRAAALECSIPTGTAATPSALALPARPGALTDLEQCRRIDGAAIRKFATHVDACLRVFVGMPFEGGDGGRADPTSEVTPFCRRKTVELFSDRFCADV